MTSRSELDSSAQEVFGPGKRSRLEWGKQVPTSVVVKSE